MSSRKLQHLIPLAILVPYIGYVVSTTFEDHNEKKRINDEKRNADKQMNKSNNM